MNYKRYLRQPAHVNFKWLPLKWRLKQQFGAMFIMGRDSVQIIYRPTETIDEQIPFDPPFSFNATPVILNDSWCINLPGYITPRQRRRAFKRLKKQRKALG